MAKSLMELAPVLSLDMMALALALLPEKMAAKARVRVDQVHGVVSVANLTTSPARRPPRSRSSSRASRP